MLTHTAATVGELVGGLVLVPEAAVWSWEILLLLIHREPAGGLTLAGVVALFLFIGEFLSHHRCVTTATTVSMSGVEEGEDEEGEEGEDEAAEEEIPVAATEEKALLKLRLSLWAADKELLSERISSVVSERGNDATI